MSSFLIRNLVFPVVLLVAAAAEAQVLTLDDCIELALKNRASIIAAHGSEDLARAGQRAALGSFLPHLSASASMGRSVMGDQKQQYTTAADTVFALLTNDTTSLSPSGIMAIEVPTEYGEYTLPDLKQDSKSASLSASMTLFDLSSWFNLAEARANRARAHLDVIASEQDMILSVKIAYFAYLAYFENVAVQQEAVKRSDEQLKLIESKYELGSAALSDVLKQKVQYGNDRLSLLSAENEATTSRADLAYAIGLDPAGPVEFSTEHQASEYAGTLEEALAFGLENQPDLLSARKSVDASRHAVKGAWAQYLPTLSGSGGYSWSASTNNDGDDDDSWRGSSSIGLSLSWTIFDGFSREYSLTSAKISRNNSLAQLADQRNYVSLEIKKAFLDMGKTRIQQEVAQGNVDAATEDLKITQEKYNLGAATILDLLDAQVSLKTAQVSLIQAGFDMNLAVATLENATGNM